MSAKPDMQLVLVQAQEAVRHARQFLEGMSTGLLGAFVEPPRGSKWAMLLTELRDTEVTLQAALIADPSPSLLTKLTKEKKP